MGIFDNMDQRTRVLEVHLWQGRTNGNIPGGALYKGQMSIVERERGEVQSHPDLENHVVLKH